MLNPAELLTMAIQIEKNGYEYYSRLADKSASEDVRRAFTFMAEQEKQHIADFTAIGQTVSSAEFEIPEEYLSPGIDAYLTSLVDGEIFSMKDIDDEFIKEITSDRIAINHAITLEKDAIIYFYEVLALLPGSEPNKKAVLELIKQEKIHLETLYELLGQVAG